MKHTCNKEHDSILNCDNDDQNMGNLIKKFHTAVSRVQCAFVLVMTSCGITSVINAQKVRLLNSNAEIYLLSKISVDRIEWICQTCDKYLKKNKIWFMLIKTFTPLHYAYLLRCIRGKIAKSSQ